MELIPIIYTTLLIFAIVTVVTIISSYVSYKVKRKVNNEDEKDKQKFTKLHEPAKPFVKVIKKRPATKPKAQPEKNIPRQKPEDKREKSFGHSERKAQRKIELPELPKRISVLNTPNTSKPVVEKKEEPVKKKKINYNSLGDDILDKYANDNDYDFHSLNATKDDE